MNSILHSILVSPFTWGLVLGLIFAGLALVRVIQLKGEMKRFKRHLSDRLEIDAESAQKRAGEVERLKKDNENLRVKIAALNEYPDRRAERDLEIYARAEKRMIIGVPGFAGPWEAAKRDALAELQGEETGQSLPKRVFSRMFPGAVDVKTAITDGSSS